MPSLTATVSTTTTTEIKPATLRKLKTRIATYASLKAQLDPIKAKMKALSEELGAIRDVETGELSLKIEGLASITLVAGTYKKFNPKLFVANGGDLAIYEASIDEKPKKAFNKITLAGQKEDDE